MSWLLTFTVFLSDMCIHLVIKHCYYILKHLCPMFNSSVGLFVFGMDGQTCMWAMSVMLHPRTGNLVVLSNGNRTAQRNQPFQEFNNGLVMSLEPLKDNQLFEVRIDKKVSEIFVVVVVTRIQLLRSFGGVSPIHIEKTTSNTILSVFSCSNCFVVL